ncbi:MAG TPA: pyridoxamine 5'-phosphate oxidase family protein [Ktedonobacteraceae bacterium]|nr:pyridoxamine 5'-phosphate oxidase family protein [Ktedonobacteraceae bacterium]
MAKQYDQITPELQSFIQAQPLFFVATAPLSEQGHVNLSPKGYETFCLLSSHHVAYLDLTGSGNETSAHLAENGRITFLFCAFRGSPQILRLYGKGETVLPGAERWEELLAYFPSYPGIRQIILASIHLVQTSCGYGVPLMEFQKNRETLERWADSKGEEGLIKYRRIANSKSLDGLPTPLTRQDEERGRPGT